MSDIAEEKQLSEEISSQVDYILGDVRKEDKTGESTDKDIPSDEVLDDDESEGIDTSDGDDESGDEAEDDDEDSVSDELLQRAIDAGMTVAEAKEFPGAKSLEYMIGKLAKNSSLDADAEGDDAGHVSKDVEEVLAGIPDIDPEVHGEDLSDAFKSLKDIILNQSKKISQLESDNSSQAAETFFERQIAGLDKDYASALKKDPDKREELLKQFKVLKAGYKATGDDVSESKIFEQAKNSVLADVKTTIIKEKLGKREKQIISRPSGQSLKASLDPFKEVGDVIHKKYYV